MNLFEFMLRDRAHHLWIYMQFKAQKSTLLHDSTQRNYTQGRTLNSTTHQAKKKKNKNNKNWGK